MWVCQEPATIDLPEGRVPTTPGLLFGIGDGSCLRRPSGIELTTAEKLGLEIARDFLSRADVLSGH